MKAYNFTVREIMNCSVESVYEVCGNSKAEAQTKIDNFIESRCADSPSINTIEAGELEVLEVEHEYTEVTKGPTLIEHDTDEFKLDELNALTEYFSAADVMEIFEELGESDDVSKDNYRIIKTDKLEGILAKELMDDIDYAAGFRASFIADLTDLSEEAIRALRDNHCEVDIHDAIERGDGFAWMAQEAMSADSAGHFFATYDGHEIEVGLYTLFRVN